MKKNVWQLLSLICVTMSSSPAQDMANSYPLLDSANFEYIGSFRVPDLSPGSSGQTFAWAGIGMTFNSVKNSLYMVGNTNYGAKSFHFFPRKYHIADHKFFTLGILPRSTSSAWHLYE